MMRVDRLARNRGVQSFAESVKRGSNVHNGWKADIEEGSLQSMVSGFHSAEDFRTVVGWELYQVTLDKYHVMFFFENGWQLLNVAHAFSYRSADGSVAYTYDVEGPRKSIELDRILRERVVEVSVRAKDRLALIFENGDELTVHDTPELRSWWFQPMPDPDHPEKAQSWCFSDEEVY